MKLSDANPNLVVFDMFGVVSSKGLESSIEPLTGVFGRSRNAVSKAYRANEIDFDLGKIDSVKFWNSVNEQLGTEIQSRILDNIVLTNYKIREETISLVNFAKRASKVVLLSNFRREWYDKLDEKYDVSSNFDKVFVSSDIGYLKPDYEIFDHVAKSCGYDPIQMYLLDDEMPNIQGMSRWGGNPIHFTNAYEAERELRNMAPSALPNYDAEYSGVFLLTESGALILQRRDKKKGIANPGKVSVFGGRLLPGETPKAAAQRELREEVSLRVRQKDLKPVVSLGYPISENQWMKCNYFCLRGVDVNEINILEGAGIEVWWPDDAVRQSDLTKLPRLVLERIEEKKLKF